MQLLVTNSPFSEAQLQQLNAVLPTLTDAQIQWLSGYLAFYRAGNVAAGAVEALPITQVATEAVSQPVVSAPKEATIVFGSQTGNAQRLAGRLSDKLKADGFEVTLSAMNKFKPNDLKKATNLFVLVSTHGEGDPPDNAISFYEFLFSKRAPKLESLSYSVLALGDTSYEFFCKTGQDFDTRLQELGAKPLTPRVDCDVDFEESASGWIQAVVSSLQSSQATAGLAVAAQATEGAVTSAGVEYTRNQPFQAEVIESINLNGRGSDRETRHLEISLEGSGISYEPGDALGIVPHNDPALVTQLLTALGWSEEVTVTSKEGVVSTVKDALTTQLEITVLSKTLLEKLAPYSKKDKLAKLIADSTAVRAYVKGRDLLDFVNDYGPLTLEPADIATVLRKIPARLYSIASSIKAHPDEVHLTIRKVQYEAHDRQRNGVCSVFVSERLEIGDKVSVFVQSNPNFKLPANPETPVIMVGPGTGVAPFRAFMEEREEIGATGKTWLFYGDRHFVTDFLYQTDWQRMHADGILTNLEVAFSRDTKEKVYVQHRLLEHAAALYTWLEEGAHVYVCGDEKHMAHDVHQALQQIVKQEKNVSDEEAAAYILQLQDNGRYQRDVY